MVAKGLSATYKLRFEKWRLLTGSCKVLDHGAHLEVFLSAIQVDPSCFDDWIQDLRKDPFHHFAEDAADCLDLLKENAFVFNHWKSKSNAEQGKPLSGPAPAEPLESAKLTKKVMPVKRCRTRQCKVLVVSL